MLFEIRLREICSTAQTKSRTAESGIPYDRVARADELEALAGRQRPDAALSMSFRCKNILGEGFLTWKLEIGCRVLGSPRHQLAFRANAIDGEVLPKLTSEDLKEIGVVAIGHRRKLLEAIAALGAQAPAARNPLPSPPPLAGEGRAGADAERRQAPMVMFCDLVGSTSLSTLFDPEDLREIIGTDHRTVAEIVAGFDGFVAKYMGDGIPSIWLSTRHEDDAERAVRAASGSIDAVGRLVVKSTNLQARVGIATGLVVVGDLIGRLRAEQSVVGETPNLAARLQALATPASLVIASNTRQQIGELLISKTSDRKR